MTALTIPRTILWPFQIAQNIRNGKAPTADIQNQLATAIGHAAYVDSKCIYHSPGELVGTGGTSLVLGSLATRYRWRFAFHTGPYAWYLTARFEIAPQDNGTPTDPYCKLEIYDTSNTLVGTCNVHGGSSAGTYADVPINMTGGAALVLNPSDLTAIANLSPDTEYTGVFADVGYARLQSAAVWEVSLNPDTDNGYAPNNLGSGGPIYSSHRNDVAAMARLLHKRSGTPVFHWCSNVDSAAPTNSAAANEANSTMTLDALTLSSTGTVSAGAVAEMTLGAFTLSSTGTIAAFDASVASPADVGTWPYATPFDVTTTATASGAAQTNGQIQLAVYDNYLPSTIITSVVSLDTAGWSETGWSYSAGVWSNTLTKASVSVGVTSPTFRVTCFNSGDVYVSCQAFLSPRTAEATGVGNNFMVELV